MESCMEFLAGAPMCVVVLDEVGKPIGCNDTFEYHMGPLYKFKNIQFDDGACGSDEARLKLGEAMHAVSSGQESKMSVKSVAMLTLEGDAGLPLRRHFDWNIGKTKATAVEGGHLILMGEPCTERTMEQRAKDAELVDFFQNAPIALHWLSGEGVILWANQTELDVLQYTAEEYIGQPVMKFCPDEEDLVLEIFKTLGSGNIIKDVPVRFRRKDGEIVPLLIDSNVNYKGDGSFNHTRCFIRDDTGRRVREARAAALTDEMTRSLKLVDNFMSNTLHFVRTPCSVTIGVLEQARELLEEIREKEGGGGGGGGGGKIGASRIQAAADEGLGMLITAVRELGALSSTLDDVSDLQRFEQGGEFRPVMRTVELLPLCKAALSRCAAKCRDGVECVLEFEQGGKTAVPTDPKQLLRVLDHLLRNSATWTSHGSIHLNISHGVYPDGTPRSIFTVSDTGRGINSMNDIFFKYHQPQVPTELDDLDVVENTRDRQVRDAADLSNESKTKGLGVGLPLSYNIVNALGGELCFTSEPGNTTFYFSLPYLPPPGWSAAAAVEGDSAADAKAYHDSIPTMEATRITLTAKEAQDEMSLSGTNFDTIMTTTDTLGSDINGDDLSTHLSSVKLPDEEARTEQRGEATARPAEATFVSVPDASKIVTPTSVANRGLAAMEPTHVLVVEDTAMCWKVLKLALTKLKCTVDVAEDGAQALEAVKKSTQTNRPYKLVLMDLRMPVMDGFEATRILKEELRYETPIIALTAETGADVRDRCKQIGFDEFVQKPLKGELLKTILREFAEHAVQ